MKKVLIPILVLVVIIGIFYWLFAGKYNNAITLQEDTITAWSNVESAYQRRSDLIGNLVKTVQGAADFERTTLKEVIDARSKATSINIDPSNITPDQIAQFQQAQSGLTSALSRLLVTVERYPDLKANQNFLNLQTQLEGTENRINVERNRYNEQVGLYNKYLRVFPNNIVLGMFGDFEKMTRFEAEEGTEKAPDVDFDFK
ncbi:LemA family protein [Aquimarina sp. 2201CG5-10]|uniref:LemA family protein n=1 Tax=Aquimarina callyspongiae TaxID=3098150 RepID=UPI002AB3F875|nr:LemA family protein [Aquimarina sp. 2201CG5-10]MDY8134603.1 LemA family protein [Aquimarina sp. 2201CG5-10]